MGEEYASSLLDMLTLDLNQFGNCCKPMSQEASPHQRGQKRGVNTLPPGEILVVPKNADELQLGWKSD